MMSAVPQTSSIVAPEEPLCSGDEMGQREFHRLYARSSRDFKAELIGGIVYVASPLSRDHATCHAQLTSLGVVYAASTLGVECGDNGTIVLGEDSEPQPDTYLRILPEFGGQSRTSEDDYVRGAPEMILEVARSSRSIDLHRKRDDYHKHGTLEYVVVNLEQQCLHWFDFREGVELAAPVDGIVRSRVFPGLWIDSLALLSRDGARLIATLQSGLASPEHAAFASLLASRRSQR